MSRSQHTLTAQIRLVMQSLISPAPHLLAVIAEVEQLDVTQVQLPVVEFSPFSTLSVPHATTRGNVTEPRPRTSAPTVPFDKSTRRQEVTLTASETVERPPPVFSFRSHTGDQLSKVEVGWRQSTSGTRPATEVVHEPLRSQERNTPEADAKITERQQARVQFSSPEKLQIPTLGEQKSLQLSSDILSWIEVATQALTGIDHPDSSRGTALSNLDANQTETNVSVVQTVRDANSETVSRSRVVDSEVMSSPLGQRDSSLKEMSTTRTVVSQTRLLSQPPPITPLGSVSISAERGSDSATSQGISQGDPLGHITFDAEEIAMLVNDILVEQARRNGVDLS